MGLSGLPWAAYVSRVEGTVSVLSSFGSLPPGAVIAAALEAVSRYDGPAASPAAPGLLVVAIDQAHALLLPDEPSVAQLSPALARVAALAGDPRRTLVPSAASPCDASSPEAILSAAPAQATASVALFSLSLRSAFDDCAARCPSAACKEAFHDLCSTIAAMLHPLGSAYRLGDDACLCAFYCRGSCDPELTAAQLTRTLRKRFGLSGLSEASVTRTASIPLGDGALEAIRSFIHGD